MNSNDDAFGSAFPYVALPNVGSVNRGGGTARRPPLEQRRRAGPEEFGRLGRAADHHGSCPGLR